jgi:hypothetical protein
VTNTSSTPRLEQFGSGSLLQHGWQIVVLRARARWIDTEGTNPVVGWRRPIVVRYGLDNGIKIVESGIATLALGG